VGEPRTSAGSAGRRATHRRARLTRRPEKSTIRPDRGIGRRHVCRPRLRPGPRRGTPKDQLRNARSLGRVGALQKTLPSAWLGDQSLWLYPDGYYCVVDMKGNPVANSVDGIGWKIISRVNGADDAFLLECGKQRFVIRSEWGSGVMDLLNDDGTVQSRLEQFVRWEGPMHEGRPHGTWTVVGPNARHPWSVSVEYKNGELVDAPEHGRQSLNGNTRSQNKVNPRRLAHSQLDPITGYLAWPRLLMMSAFSDVRHDLDRLFAQRSAQREMSNELCLLIIDRVDTMKAQLLGLGMPTRPTDYADAVQYLERMRYEARFSPGF
jgi:hypothetical protein